jgi:hypothetical protein
MSKHCYALVNADGAIVRTTEPLEMAPAPVNFHVWQQVPDDTPAFNPQLHERHSPKFVMRGHRVHREFQIRRKGVA